MGGRCTNVPGSFRCSCEQVRFVMTLPSVTSLLQGFMLDSSGQVCEDQDECRVENGGCSQLCVNTPGHRQCK